MKETLHTPVAAAEKEILSGARQQISLGQNMIEEKMRRKPCCSRTTESDSTSVFVTGSTNFKIETILSLEKSNGHNEQLQPLKLQRTCIQHHCHGCFRLCLKMLLRNWRDYSTLLTLWHKSVLITKRSTGTLRRVR